MIESLFGDKTCSWVKIVSGIVTEMSEGTLVESVGEKSTGKPVAKERPQQTSNSTLSPVSIPYLERKWIDMEPGTFDQNCLEVSKLTTRLLRHDDSVNREEDEAVKFEDLASRFQSRITSSSHWSIRTLLSFLQRGGGMKKRFQDCVDPSSPETFLYLRAKESHSGGTHGGPTLQDNVLLPSDFAEHIYHVGSSHVLHSIIQSGLIPGGKSVKKERHAVMFVDRHNGVEYDLTNPRIAVYKNLWKTFQNTVYWCTLKVAQKKGLQFYQTRSNASSFTTHYLLYVSRKWYT